MTQIQKFKNYFIALLMVFAVFFTAMPVFAANIFFDAKNQSFAQGEEFLINVFLDTEGESVNAIEGIVIFPTDLLEAEEARDGNSIINFWIKQPKASDREILFSGIIPGGYQETKGFLFSVIFKAKASGSGVIEMNDIKVLLNDGKGTSTRFKISPFQFSISQKTSDALFKPQVMEDVNPPEEFKPEIARNNEMFDGKYFLVFATQDKGIGIDHYEVREGSLGKFVAAESPYLLQNQNLDKEIAVKAVDKNGNKRVAVLPLQKPISRYQNYWIFVILIIIGFAIVGVILKKILWRK